ncbi:MAG: 30S ribosomal protein S11 [Candidatus Sungiibacteriota bacterium]
MGKKRIITKGGQGGSDTAQKKTETAGGRRHVALGIAHIQATYNNTLILISDERGNALVSASAGGSGFSGTRKATPYAAARVAEVVAEKAKRLGMADLHVRVSGVGAGRDSAVRALANNGFNLLSIRDITPIPHNGPRKPKVRRV